MLFCVGCAAVVFTNMPPKRRRATVGRSTPDAKRMRVFRQQQRNQNLADIENDNRPELNNENNPEINNANDPELNYEKHNFS